MKFEEVEGDGVEQVRSECPGAADGGAGGRTGQGQRRTHLRLLHAPHRRRVICLFLLHDLLTLISIKWL